MVRLPPRLRPLFPVLKPPIVRATRMATPLARRMGRARGSWAPTGFVDTLEEAAASSGGRSAVARPAEVLSRPPMRGWPAAVPLTDRRQGESVERIAVAELPGARVLGKHRAVVTSRGLLVDEASRYFGTSRPGEHPVLLNPFTEPPLHVAGRLGLLAVRGDYNYYHFLMDAIPRLHTLEQAGWLDVPERWYVPTTTAFQRELLDLVGMDPALIVDADTYQHVQADSLVVAGVPGLGGAIEKNPPWVVHFLRERLMPRVGLSAVAEPHRRIWITRGPSAHNRAVRNEAAVLDLLVPRGFEAVDPAALSVAEQMRTFAEAAVVVSAHGAALTNLVFASPGCTVIEVFPTGALLPDYWRLAAGVPGLRYRYLSGPMPRRRPTRNNVMIRDIDVDLDALTELLAEAGAR